MARNRAVPVVGRRAFMKPCLLLKRWPGNGDPASLASARSGAGGALGSAPASALAKLAVPFAAAFTRLAALEMFAKGARSVTGDASRNFRQTAAGIDHRLHLVAQQVALRREEVA